jgi:hypothetical protein
MTLLEPMFKIISRRLKLAASTLSFVSGAAMAGDIALPSGTYQVSDVAGEQILLVAPQARISRDQDAPVPKCDDIYRHLEQAQRNIEMCLGHDGAISQSVCDVEALAIRRLIVRKDVMPIGEVDLDSVQHWSIQLTDGTVRVAAEAEAAQILSKPRQAFVSGTPQGSSLSSVRVLPSSGSWSEKIDWFTKVNVHPDATISSSGDQLTTRSRLLACDLLRGKAHVVGEVDAAYMAGVVGDPSAVQPMWSLYQSMKSYLTIFPHRRERLMAYGFEATKFLFDSHQSAEFDDVRKLVGVFLPATDSNGDLTVFANSFELARTLPRKNITINASWSLQLENSVGSGTVPL